MGTGPLVAIEGTVCSGWSVQLGEPHVVVQTSAGICFELEVFSKSKRLEWIQSESQLTRTFFVAEILREDQRTLYAFENLEERKLFNEIKELDSLGPKSAALAVAALGPEGLLRLFENKSPAGLKVVGLGPKTLEKLGQGMRSRSKVFVPLLQSSARSVGFQNLSESSADGFSSENHLALILALERLGMQRQQAELLLKRSLQEAPEISASDRLQHVLQMWGREQINFRMKNSR